MKKPTPTAKPFKVEADKPPEMSIAQKLRHPMQFQWRAQASYQHSSRLLAYIDARDAQDRLDKAVGPENWQDEYYILNSRLFCKVGINYGSGLVWKSDCGSDSAVEKEKGAASDAFKRACVKHGLGRFLYRMDFVTVGSIAGKSGKYLPAPNVNQMQLIAQAGNPNRYINKEHGFWNAKSMTLFVNEIVLPSKKY